MGGGPHDQTTGSNVEKRNRGKKNEEKKWEEVEEGRGACKCSTAGVIFCSVLMVV